VLGGWELQPECHHSKGVGYQGEVLGGAGESKGAEAVRWGGQVQGGNKVFVERIGGSCVCPAVSCGEWKGVARTCRQQ